MKKSIFTLMSIVALFAASCTTDATSDVQMVGGEEAVVTFSVQTTGLGSRAVDINDGKKATELTYAIYDEAWNHLQTYEAEFENGSLVKELSLRLVKNKTYNFVFWAQNPNVTCYTMDFETAGQKPSVSVNYDALVANNDNYDAFFGQELALTVNGTVNKTVYLKRPFAQINFGTDDLQAAQELGFDLAQAKVSVTTMTYSKFFLNDGAVDGATREVTFTEADAIDKTAADKARKAAEKSIKELEKRLAEAREDAAGARRDLQELKDNPELPEEVMEKLRSQFGAAAAEAEAKAAALEKQLAMASPELTEFQVHMKAAQQEIAAMKELIKKVPEELAAKLRAAARAVAERFSTELEEKT